MSVPTAFTESCTSHWDLGLSCPCLSFLLAAEIQNRKSAWRASWSGWPATSGTGTTNGICNRTARLSKPNVLWPPKFPAILTLGDQGVGIHCICSWWGLQPHSTSSMSRLAALVINYRLCAFGQVSYISEPQFLPCKMGIKVLALFMMRAFNTGGLLWNILLLLSISSWRRKGDNTQDIPNWPSTCIDFVGGKIRSDTLSENVELLMESL